MNGLTQKEASEALSLDDCINARCPWSGELVSVDSLTQYRGQVVGFCNPGCRDKFARAIACFEDSNRAPCGGYSDPAS